jgi:hypothetical protein
LEILQRRLAARSEILMNKDVARMKRMIQAGIASATAFALIACGGYASVPPQSSSASSNGQVLSETLAAAITNGYVVSTCPTPSPGQVACQGYFFTSTGLQAMRSSASSLRKGMATDPSTLPQTLQNVLSAYGLTSLSASGGQGRTVAIVEVGDDPYIESDLQVYRSYYGFPVCTVANGCLRKVNENGGSTLPAANTSWYSEYIDDVDAVAGICPNCSILIVEASTIAMSDVAVAENTAAGMGVTSIVNSYAAPEVGMQQYASAYNHPGIAIIAASGNNDWSTGAQVPASYSTVIAVGGTTLTAASNARGWIDAVYPWGNGGCSTITPKPAWQHDTGCAMRTTADVAFDSGWTPPEYGHFGPDQPTFENGAWTTGGGTSYSTAAIAAIYGLTGTPVNNASTLYANATQLYDVTSGSVLGQTDGSGGCLPPVPGPTPGQVINQSIFTRNALSKRQTLDLPGYFCMGEAGYNAPTGNGTPNGPGAFTAGGCPITSGGTPNPHPTENSKGVGACGAS